jgi:peptidoglycan/LPS O-acetylase OafA/YrhL
MTSRLFKNRSALLDTLRALAVTMVVIFHVATRYPADSLDPVARFFLRFGFLGVDIFYPLSGFLITRFLLSHDGPGSIRAFFLRRVFRIIPLYLVAVTIFYIAARVTGYEAGNLGYIWATYTFLTGWFAFAHGPDSVPYTITWSLSVEEFAYLTFGIAAWVARRSFPVFLTIVAVFPFLLRLYLYGAGYENIYYFPLARLDSIAMGGLTALLIGRVPHLWAWLLGATVVAFTFWQGGGVFGQAMLFTTVTLAACTAIALAESVFKSVRGRVWDWMAEVGLYSYFIYLFHFFTLYALDMVFRKSGLGLPHFWFMSLLCMGGTFILGWLSFRFFEEPLMMFGRRLERRTKPSVVMAGGSE